MFIHVGSTALSMLQRVRHNILKKEHSINSPGKNLRNSLETISGAFYGDMPRALT